MHEITWQDLIGRKAEIIGNDVVFDTIFKGRLQNVTIDDDSVTLEFDWIAFKGAENHWHRFTGFSDLKVSFRASSGNKLTVSDDGKSISFSSGHCAGKFYCVPDLNIDPKIIRP